MSLKNIYNKLVDLSNLSSTNDKKEKLNFCLKNPLFRKVCFYALDPRKKYKIKKLPAFQYQTPMVISTVDDIFKTLDVLSQQKGTSKRDKEHLSYIASIDKETWEIVNRICNDDLRCGCGVRTINKIHPGLIPFTPYLRCSSHRNLHKAKEIGIVQEKANGMYAEMVIENNKIKFGTRDSHEIHMLDHLKEIYLDAFDGLLDEVLMGELRVRNDDGSIADRATGNGIINQCIQGTADSKDAFRVFFSMWDIVDLIDYKNERCNVPYHKRLQILEEIVELIHEDNEQAFQIIDYKYCSKEEAQEYANEIIKNGGEGAVYKHIDAIWKHGTSTEQYKIKARFEGELRAIDWEYGDKGKKHEHRMGRIIFETDDGMVRTAVGSGFSDEFREEDMDKYMGRIGELFFESVSESKSRKDNEPKYALYGPAVFECWRDDKDSTDTFTDLMER